MKQTPKFIDQTRSFGHSLAWGNPHTLPPDGMPPVIAQVFDGERRRSAQTEQKILQSWPKDAKFEYTLGCGYNWHLLMPITERKQWSESTKKKARKKRAATRISKECPLFKDELIQRLDEED